MQGVYYEWLKSTVLWMNSINLHLIWNKKIASLLHKFLQAYWNLVFILCLFWKLYIDHLAVMIRSSILFCFACMFNQAWKLQYMVKPEISSLVIIMYFVYYLYPDCMAGKMTIYVFAFWTWKTQETRLSHHRLLVRKFNICKIYRYLMQPEKINTFKPTICWFFLMAAPLSFYFENHLYTSLLKVTPLTNLVWKKIVFSFVSILLLNFSFCFSFSF